MALTKITSRILDSSGVTTVGTISTGVWQGTAINQTYLVGQSGTNTGDETLARINALDVTELGTISSGVWNGTVIASAYLDADTAHLSTTQTFTGAKTFSSGGIFSSSSQGKLKLVAGSNEYLSLEFANASGTTQWEISKNNTHDLYFYKGGHIMMLKADGKVGIGTTSPSSKLKVEGNAATSGLSIKSAGNGGTYPFMVTWSGGSEGDAFCINDSLNVGIGTSSPAELLEVKASSSPAIQINQNNQYKSIIRLGGNDLEIRGSSGVMEFYNGSADGDSSALRMSISSGGEVKINTAGSGSNKLQVVGGIRNWNSALTLSSRLETDGLYFSGAQDAYVVSQQALNFYAGNALKMSIASGGDVGIGINPTAGYKLDVSGGDVRFGAGLKFASGSTLSSYDEGTFSPYVQKNDSSGSGQLSSGSQTRVGRYIRVGNQVAIWIYIYVAAGNTTTSGNNAWLVQGLPFTFRGSTPYQFLPSGYGAISGNQLERHMRLQINSNTDSGVIYGRSTLDTTNNNGGLLEFSFSGVLEIN